MLFAFHLTADQGFYLSMDKGAVEDIPYIEARNALEEDDDGMFEELEQIMIIQVETTSCPSVHALPLPPCPCAATATLSMCCHPYVSPLT